MDADLGNRVSQLAEELAAVQEKIARLEARLDADEHAGTARSSESKGFRALRQQVDDLDGKVGDQGKRLSTVETDTQNLDTRLGGLEGETKRLDGVIQDQDTRLGGVEGQTATLATRVGTVEGEIQQVRVDVGQHGTQLRDMKDQTDLLAGDVQRLDGAIQDHEGRLGAVEGEVTRLDGVATKVIDLLTPKQPPAATRGEKQTAEDQIRTRYAQIDVLGDKSQICLTHLLSDGSHDPRLRALGAPYTGQLRGIVTDADDMKRWLERQIKAVEAARTKAEVDQFMADVQEQADRKLGEYKQAINGLRRSAEASLAQAKRQATAFPGSADSEEIDDWETITERLSDLSKRLP